MPNIPQKYGEGTEEEKTGKKRSARTLKCLKAHENILTATTSTKESIDAHRVVSRRVYSKEK